MKDTPVAPLQDDSLVLSLVGIAHEIEDRLEAALDGLGLSLAKVGVLRNLADAGTPLSLSELAERSSCVRSNITQLVDRLEADQLVRRVKDPNDRRGIKAELTPAGAKACAEAVQLLAAAQRSVIGALTLEHREALQEVLTRLGS